jgi:acetyl esterase/lipase
LFLGLIILTGAASMKRLVSSTAILFLALGFCFTAAPLRGADVVVEPDITYGKAGDVELKLDLARPEASSELHPAIVYIHGGGWQFGGRNEFKKEIEEAARRGYVAVTVTYRLSDPDSSHKPRHPFPAQIEDVKCAVRWLRANAEKYHVDPNRIGATGDSAGGHLSLLVGVTGSVHELEGNGGNPGVSSGVQAVVNYFGPTDLAKLYATSNRASGLVKTLMDGTPEEHPDRYREASPVTYVSKDSPPTLSIHGTADNVVPPDQAVEFDAAMKKAGASHTLMMLPGEGHGFKKDAARKALEAKFKFFDEHLKRAS